MQGLHFRNTSVIVYPNGQVLQPKGGGYPERLTFGTDFKDGYRRVSINKKRYQVHRMVAEVFLPNPCNLPIVNHIDSNKLNNDVTNLEWCSYSYNSRHFAQTTKGKENAKHVSDKLKGRPKILGCGKPDVPVTLTKDDVTLHFATVKEANKYFGWPSSVLYTYIKRGCKSYKGWTLSSQPN